MLMLTILLILAYLLGSLSSAVIACHLLNLPDPRTAGSKNPGATNVYRLGGKKAAGLVLIADVLKGVIAVLIAQLCGLEDTNLALVALAVFLGHLFPIFFGFHGGKGVATAFGSLLMLSPLVAIAAAIIWVIVAKLFQYSSLAALISACATSFLCLFFGNPNYFPPLFVIMLLLIYRHRTNIYRLIEGTETKMSKK